MMPRSHPSHRTVRLHAVMVMFGAFLLIGCTQTTEEAPPPSQGGGAAMSVQEEAGPVMPTPTPTHAKSPGSKMDKPTGK